MKQCPVLGCRRERHGIFCPTHWHLLPRDIKYKLRHELCRPVLNLAIAVAIEQEQALHDLVWAPRAIPELLPSQGSTS